MSFAAIDAWRAQLRTIQPLVPALSPQGATEALRVALDALDAVPPLLDRPAPAHTVFVAARTVFTAPIEWCAVLLGRGGRVTIKAPQSLLPWFQQLAAATDLPLFATADRDVIQTADRVIVMGTDATVHTIQSSCPSVLGFGQRFSIAWWTDPASADALAYDLALHDGRGCMSPVAIFSPLSDAPSVLAAAMERLQRRFPRGSLSPAEGALLRERGAVAAVLGSRTVGSGFEVLTLPTAQFRPLSMPRVAVIHPCPTVEDIRACVHPYAHQLSVFGTDSPHRLFNARISPLGAMQTPPLVRQHDGIHWVDKI